MPIPVAVEKAVTTGSAATTTISPTMSLAEAARREWDMLVVGAGPAGALAAREVARRGASVLLVDKSPFPRWKVCGCCLNGAALAALDQAGLSELPQRLGARPLVRWRLCTHAGQAVCPLPTGLSLSREAFDAALVEEAIAAGANFLSETSAELTESGSAGNETALNIILAQASQHVSLRSSILIAADGLSGRLLDGRPEFKTSIARNARLGAGTILNDGPDFFDDGTIFMTSGRGGYVGLVRLEDGRLDVAAAFDRDHVRDAGGPAAAAAKILEEANVPIPPGMWDATWRGTPALTRRRACVASERIFVIGDAAGYIEPFTGEGIAWALQSAIAVAPLAISAADSWSPDFASRWTKLHRNLVGTRQRSCRWLGTLLKSPLLTNTLVRLLAHLPWLAAPMVRAINAPARKLPDLNAEMKQVKT
jgi:flavin-dependent dehydrogenase